MYNPKFLAFATHYGFRPQACRVRRPQTKGKVERRFFYVETSLLNGRTFDTLEDLNAVTAQWLREVADVRRLRDFKESPAERDAREQPHLLPLPAADFDTALVLYRHVNVEGFVAYRLNFYSVPWSYIGQVVPVRILDDEVIVYSIGLEEIVRHRLVPSTWYKIIDARSQRSSTALVTNIDFESWAEYLGDAPLAMAMLDRVVDGATIVKLKGKSYRVHRGGDAPSEK